MHSGSGATSSPGTVTDVDTSSLSPSDGAVALRSLPRRYREATALRDGDNDRRIYESPGILAVSVLDLTVNTVRSLTLLRRALEDALVSEKPTLHPATLDRDERDFDSVAHGHLSSVLDELDDVAPEFADRIEHLPSAEWARTASVPGGTEVTALQLLQEAVSTAIDNLRDVEVTMRQLRGA